MAYKSLRDQVNRRPTHAYYTPLVLLGISLLTGYPKKNYTKKKSGAVAHLSVRGWLLPSWIETNEIDYVTDALPYH